MDIIKFIICILLGILNIPFVFKYNMKFNAFCWGWCWGIALTFLIG